MLIEYKTLIDDIVYSKDYHQLCFVVLTITPFLVLLTAYYIPIISHFIVVCKVMHIPRITPFYCSIHSVLYFHDCPFLFVKFTVFCISRISPFYWSNHGIVIFHGLPLCFCSIHDILYFYDYPLSLSYSRYFIFPLQPYAL